jgi:DNA-binding XRE family transcriptional regulator
MNPEICSQMKKHIQQFRAGKPEVSDAKLAKELDLNVSTLNRILHENTNPSLDVTLKILMNTGNYEQIPHTLKNINPLLFEVYETLYQHNQEYEVVKNKNVHYFADEQYEWLLGHIYTENGLSLEEQQALSDRDKKKLEHLIQIDLAMKVESGIVTGVVDSYKMPNQIFLKQIQNTIKYYRLEESGQFNNWASFQTERLSKEELSEYKEILRKQFIERKKFIHDASGGDNLIFTSVVSSTFNELEDLS